MGWDDGWLRGLKPKPPLQMLLLQKSWGYPQRLYSRSLRMPLHPPLWAPNKPGHSHGGLTSLSPAQLPPSPLPSLLGSLPSPGPNVGMLNPRQLKKKKKKKDKRKGRVFLFCRIVSCLSSGYICSEKPRTGAFWSTSQMTRLLMGAGQCHIWFHAYSWREPHSWDHGLWRRKIKRCLPPTPGMKNGIVEMSLPGKSWSESIFYFEKREIEFASETQPALATRTKLRGSILTKTLRPEITYLTLP